MEVVPGLQLKHSKDEVKEPQDPAGSRSRFHRGVRCVEDRPPPPATPPPLIGLTCLLNDHFQRWDSHHDPSSHRSGSVQFWLIKL